MSSGNGGIDQNRPLHGSHNWNNIVAIQTALGVDVSVAAWLEFWDGLAKADQEIYRTMDLAQIDDFDLPRPPKAE